MKITCLFRRWMIFEALLYSAEAYMVSYIYYLEGSTVSLKCLFFGHLGWIGPAHTRSFFEKSAISIHGNRRTWNVTAYTDGQSIISDLSHRFRFTLNMPTKSGRQLQITNASVMDEGLYVCKNSILDIWYILKMIDASRVRYIYYPESSTVLLKCLLDMEWFGPDFYPFYEPQMVDMYENRSMWMVYRYTEGGSVVPLVSDHNRLKVIRQIQTGDYELQISNASALDEGLYFCQNSEMPAAPDYYILQLINKSMVSNMHGMIEEINEGETKKLCCHLDSNPTLTSLKWLKGNKTVLVTQDVNQTCHTIKSVSRYDQANYTCIAENVIESGSVTVVLKVKYKPHVSIKKDLIENVKEGETKKLCCCIESYPSATVTRWLKGSQEIKVAYNVTDVCYTINNISRYDQGIYTCTAKNIVGVGSSSTVLQVKYKPQVSIKEDLIENVKKGETKKLCCCIESYPSATVTRWLKGSQEIKVAFNVTDVCYTINNISRYDQGIYTCTAENIVGNGSSSTVLQVKYKPLVSSMQDSIEEINEGETKKLCCFVDSNPTPTSTRWFNRSQEILVTHNVNTTYYTIKSVNRYDQGNYTCTAENILGIGSVTIVLIVNYKPVVSRKHDLFEEINEGETKNLCCYVDSNTVITSTRWLNGSQEIFITHNVTETSSPTSTRWFKGGQEISLNATEICYTIKNVSRYDQGIYTCTAENIVGSGSITTVLQVKSNYQLKENAQPLQSVVLGGLLGTIAVLVVGIAILFFHMKRKKKQRILSTIHLGSQRGNDDESGHYMEIYMIDESIMTPSQENSRPIIATVERSIVETRDIAPISAGHSSTSSENERNAQVYLEDGYEHPYNTLLAINREEDEHVYLTPIKTSNNENASPSENATCGCSYKLTEQDSLPDESQTQYNANDSEENTESVL